MRRPHFDSRSGTEFGAYPSSSSLPSGSRTVLSVFDFKGTDEEPPRRPRIAALSGAFLAMVGLTLAAMVVLGFLLIWTVGMIRD